MPDQSEPDLHCPIDPSQSAPVLREWPESTGNQCTQRRTERLRTAILRYHRDFIV
jgi:hypothetical protein